MKREAVVLDGIMLLWFVLTALSVLFVVWDIRSTPESPVLKWAFVLITAYIGPLGAFLYVLGCREPLPGLHERYVANRWRQVLGSTMHCVAGDGVGILAGAVIAGLLQLSVMADLTLEYVLGFGFGWTIFQALFMRDTAGGSYWRALASTFVPELLSMNALMGGMIPVMTAAMATVAGSHSPLTLTFWFIMSMALLVGFIVAYPINWWLVAYNLKHGMMTVRPAGDTDIAVDPHANHSVSDGRKAEKSADGVSADHNRAGHGGPSAHTASSGAVALMTLLSFALLALGLAVSYLSGGLQR